MAIEYPPHVPRYVEPSPRVSLQAITVPILIVFLGAAGLVTATHYATKQMSDMHQTLRQIDEKVGDVKTNMEREVLSIKTDLKLRTAERWSRLDHEIWCAKTEAKNVELGWKCAPAPGQSIVNRRIRDMAFPTIDGWAVR